MGGASQRESIISDKYRLVKKIARPDYSYRFRPLVFVRVTLILQGSQFEAAVAAQFRPLTGQRELNLQSWREGRGTCQWGEPGKPEE